MTARQLLKAFARPALWMNILALAAMIVLKGSATPPKAANDLASGNTIQATGRVEILVESSGLYEISFDELESMGLTISDPVQLTLENRGQKVPIWTVKEPGRPGRLQFYGQETCSRYTRDNVYILRVGSQNSSIQIGSTVKETCRESEQQSTGADRVAMSSLHFEENKLYLPLAAGTDHWFWQTVLASKSISIIINLPGITPGESQLRVALWSPTSAPANPDHRTILRINDRQVLDEAWEGMGEHILNVTLSDGVLKKGENRLALELPAIPGVIANSVSLNWIEIDAPARLVANHDLLSFSSPGGAQRLSGFSSRPMLLDVTDKSQPLGVAIDESSNLPNGEVQFQSQAGHHYLAVGPQGILHPAGLTMVETNEYVLTPDIEADYVAIGPPDLLQALQPLLDWRSAHGLKVLALPVGSIYDQFNGGIPEPQAIKAFLQATSKAWKSPPRFLLLIGDTTYDPQGYVATEEANRLPSFLIDTTFGGETASDVPFEAYQNDSKPQIAVGRLPARTPQQVADYVQKVLAYEKQVSKGQTSITIAAVADGQDISFRDEAKSFLGRLPTADNKVLLSPEPGDARAAVKVSEYFIQGVDWIAYFGHGSISMWGKDKLFTTQDAIALTGQVRYPLVINMTCLTGYFIHPKMDTITDALLWNPDGGSVGIIAPTSLTMPTDQGILSSAFAQVMVEGRSKTLGELLLNAQRSLPQEKAGYRDVLLTFLLFGDPALTVPSGE